MAALYIRLAKAIIVCSATVSLLFHSAACQYTLDRDSRFLFISKGTADDDDDDEKWANGKREIERKIRIECKTEGFFLAGHAA